MEGFFFLNMISEQMIFGFIRKIKKFSVTLNNKRGLQQAVSESVHTINPAQYFAVLG